MPEQNYTNHRQTVLAYHRILFPLVLAILIGSLVNVFKSLGDHHRLYNAALIVAIAIALTLLTLLCRMFALKAQDRAIRAEENLRHYVMTGHLLDERLTIRQIIALRFASAEEFVALAQRAAAESLPPDTIKQAIKYWRADTHRV